MFLIEILDCKTYEVSVTILDRAEHFYGSERECRIVECMSEYNVDGIRGHGITEWQNRNMQGNISKELGNGL